MILINSVNMRFCNWKLAAKTLQEAPEVTCRF